MTRNEIRAEEDFAESKGITLCEMCKKRESCFCKVCAHHYKSHYEMDPVVQTMRN